MDGRRVAALHRELLPLGDANVGPEGFAARIEPYRSAVRPGDAVELHVAVRNPFDRATTASVGLIVPAGWSAEPARADVSLPPRGEGTVVFRAHAGAQPVHRARVAADVTVAEVRLGQQAEALVDVR